MATINPTILTSTTPGLQVTTSVPAMSYEGLINSLGPNVFDIDELYYANQMQVQFAYPIKYNNYDNFGNADGETISTPIDPNQFQPTQFVKLKGRGIVFDGQNYLNFLFLAGNAIQFIFYGKQLNISNALNLIGDTDNFKSVAKALGKPGFYDDDQHEEKPEPKGTLEIQFVDDDAPKKETSFSAEPIVQQIRKQTFILNLVNNTSGNIPLILMQEDNPANNIANATTRYQWDITGISYATPNVTINSYPVGSSGANSSLTGSLLTQNAQGLVNLLNSFNNGIFWLETSGPNTYIVTWNNNVVYGQLSVGVATTSIVWSNTSTNEKISVLSNAVLIISSVAPPQGGTVTVNNGDAITGTGSPILALPILFSFLVTRTSKFPPFATQTIQSIISQGGGLFFLTPFTIDAGYTYSISLTP